MILKNAETILFSRRKLISFFQPSSTHRFVIFEAVDEELNINVIFGNVFPPIFSRKMFNNVNFSTKKNCNRLLLFVRCTRYIFQKKNRKAFFPSNF